MRNAKRGEQMMKRCLLLAGALVIGAFAGCASAALERGESLFWKGDYDAAVRSLEEGLREEQSLSPASPRKWFQNGSYVTRCAILARCARVKAAEAHAETAMNLFIANKLNDAQEEFRKAQEFNPEDPLAAAMMAQIDRVKLYARERLAEMSAKMESGAWDDAVAIGEEIIYFSDTYPEIREKLNIARQESSRLHRRAGEEHFAKEQYSAAQQEFYIALSMQPEDGQLEELRQRAAAHLAAAGFCDQADKIAESNPEAAHGLYMRALERVPTFPRAVAGEQAARMKWAADLFSSARARAASEAKEDRIAALQMLTKCQQLAPNLPELPDSIAKARHALAMSYYNEAANLWADSPTAHACLVAALLLKAQELSPNIARLQEILARAGRIADAKSAIFLSITPDKPGTLAETAARFLAQRVPVSAPGPFVITTRGGAEAVAGAGDPTAAARESLAAVPPEGRGEIIELEMQVVTDADNAAEEAAVQQARARYVSGMEEKKNPTWKECTDAMLKISQELAQLQRRFAEELSGFETARLQVEQASAVHKAAAARSSKATSIRDYLIQESRRLEQLSLPTGAGAAKESAGAMEPVVKQAGQELANATETLENRRREAAEFSKRTCDVLEEIRERESAMLANRHYVDRYPASEMAPVVSEAAYSQARLKLGSDVKLTAVVRLKSSGEAIKTLAVHAVNNVEDDVVSGRRETDLDGAAGANRPRRFLPRDEFHAENRSAALRDLHQETCRFLSAYHHRYFSAAEAHLKDGRLADAAENYLRFIRLDMGRSQELSDLARQRVDEVLGRSLLGK